MIRHLLREIADLWFMVRFAVADRLDRRGGKEAR